MESVRLTKSKTDLLITKLIEHAFLDSALDLINRGKSLAHKAYDLSFSKKERDLIDSIPKNWLSNRGYIQFVFSESKIGAPSSYNQLQFNGYIYKLLSSKKIDNTVINKPFPDYFRSVLINDTEFINEYESYSNDLGKFLEKTKTARHNADAIIKSVTTTNRLIEVWPETKPFVDELFKAEKVSLPAVVKDDINKMFKLPV